MIERAEAIGHPAPPERWLRLGEDGLRLALESGRMGAWEWELGTDKVTWDARQFELFGLDPAGFCGTLAEVFAAVHVEDRETLREAVQRAVDGADDYEAEFRVVHPDGATRWIAGRGRVIRDALGRPLRMMGVNFDVTRTRADAEALTAAEQRMLLLQRSLRVAMFTAAATPPFETTWISEGVETLTGFPPAAFLRDPGFWAGRIHPADRAAVLSAVADPAPGASLRCDYRWLHADGDYRWFQDEVVLLPGERGRPGQLVGIWLDVSAQRREEEALRAAERRIVLLEHALPAAFFTARAEGDFGATWMSEGVLALTGYPAERFVRQPGLWVERLHPDDRAQALELPARARAGEPLRSEYRWRCADGTYRWFSAELLLVPGEPGQFVGVWLDVTERREAEEARRRARELAERERAADALRESEERLRLALEAAAMGTWEWDLGADRLVLGLQAAAQLELGTPSFEGSAEAALSHLHPADRASLAEEVTRLLPGAGPLLRELRVLRPDGAVRWLAGSWRQLSGAAGAVRLIGVTRDVTPRKRAEQELDLLLQLALVVGRAESLAQAVEGALERICRTTGWALGEAWLPDEADQVLRLGSCWCQPGDPALRDLGDVARGLAFRRGEGLPGRAWATGRREWLVGSATGARSPGRRPRTAPGSTAPSWCRSPRAVGRWPCSPSCSRAARRRTSGRRAWSRPRWRPSPRPSSAGAPSRPCCGARSATGRSSTS